MCDPNYNLCATCASKKRWCQMPTAGEKASGAAVLEKKVVEIIDGTDGMRRKNGALPKESSVLRVLSRTFIVFDCDLHSDEVARAMRHADEKWLCGGRIYDRELKDKEDDGDDEEDEEEDEDADEDEEEDDDDPPARRRTILTFRELVEEVESETQARRLWATLKSATGKGLDAARKRSERQNDEEKKRVQEQEERNKRPAVS
eukprot:gene24320-60426_t